MNAQERYDYWNGLVKNWRISGKSISRWCMENGINKNSFYKWRKIIDTDELSQPVKSDGRFFAPVLIDNPTRKITITVNDVELTFDESLLCKVIGAIK